jgi:hypothetical protein
MIGWHGRLAMPETDKYTFVFRPDWKEHNDITIDKLAWLAGCVESVERKFGIEFSCGDGFFLSDPLTDEQLEKYDGQVDLTFPARVMDTKKILDRVNLKIVYTSKSVHFYRGTKKTHTEAIEGSCWD